MPEPFINALSIDLEDWYQGLTSTSRRFEGWSRFEDRIACGTSLLLDLLSEANTTATFFVLGRVVETHAELVRAICSRGHEIATHGYRHRLVHEMAPHEFRADVERSIGLLQDATGATVAGYRAPAFSIDQRSAWALPLLEELGLRYDSSIAATRNPLYGWPGSPRFAHRAPGTRGLVELPVSTVRIGWWTVPVGGGFYIRAYPLAFTRWAIRRINAEGQPAVLYFHPWEFDPGHPQPGCVTHRERVSHYYNLHAAEAKLRGLLDSFRFAGVGQVLDRIGLGESSWLRSAWHPIGSDWDTPSQEGAP